MSGHSVEHSTIVLERTYDASPARVFGAWSTREALMRWANPGAGWVSGIDHFDFSVGGSDRSWFGPSADELYVSESRYLDIVPDRRIVSAGAMTAKGTRIFVGMLTVTLDPAGDGRCRMVMTEQGVFLDGHDIPANHQIGWQAMLDNLGAELRRDTGPA